MYHLFIPTRSRIGLDKQITLRDVIEFGSETLKSRTYLVCPESEEKYHRGYWERVISCPASGIGPTRDWILNLNFDSDIRFMFDDDMYFFQRADLDGDPYLGLERINSLDNVVNELYYWMDKEDFAHTAVSARQGNNRELRPFVDITRANNCHGYKRSVLLKHGINFLRLPVMEDFDVTLQLLELGYPNRVSYRYAWNQRGSGTSGGCSDYRDAMMQSEAAHKLKELHYDFVKVVEKEGEWNNMRVRHDVVIQWKKAFGSRRINHAPPAR